MTNRAFWTLVGVEFRRSRRTLVRLGIVLVAVLVLSVVMESASSVLAFGLTAVGFGVGLQMSFDTISDKLTGGLEALTTLPVSASTLAAARLAAMVLGAAPGAVLMAVGSGIVGPAFLEDTGLIRIFIAAFLAAWVSLSSVSAAVAALVLRFKTKLLISYGGLVIMGTVGGALFLFDRFIGSPMRLIYAVMTSDHALAIAIGSALVASALVLAGSFLLARKGLEIYEPEPDAMDW